MESTIIGISQTSVDFTAKKMNTFGQKPGDSTKELQAEAAKTVKSEDSGKSTQQMGTSADTVTISEEGREKAQQTAAGKIGGKVGTEEEGEKDAATIAREAVLRQIREVKEKLQDAQARLAQAQGGASSGNNKVDEDSLEAAAAVELLTGNTEAKAIQGEIEMLAQKLMLLNEQLLAMSQQGGVSAGGGTRAGIGGESKGPSGQGQRISVSA